MGSEGDALEPHRPDHSHCEEAGTEGWPAEDWINAGWLGQLHGKWHAALAGTSAEEGATLQRGCSRIAHRRSPVRATSRKISSPPSLICFCHIHPPTASTSPWRTPPRERTAPHVGRGRCWQ